MKFTKLLQLLSNFTNTTIPPSLPSTSAAGNAAYRDLGRRRPGPNGLRRPRPLQLTVPRTAPARRSAPQPPRIKHPYNGL